ncbi:MAG: serine protease [Candidatus Scalindua sp. AMX11]|nr:MAG: serine protease [Candidatus Scalindua sp.]NOG85679.1 trypsin-like peptidase domain-containing protein [Planctomycetota bacterium]RZV82428.1 MAG: serine protease [Candidatus Scalindua sp. SCAELEC01]TDE65650.1 MAG: serine protease [Candidatus Scalindua sp. AMX11]GJQ59152.1 MAG: hypothetical protein SCALA701_19530 [Candidatus Scalindua sp.]
METKGTFELILEIVKIVLSWPVVAFLIFLFLINPIRSLIRSWEGRITEISTPVGSVKILPPEKLGEAKPELAEKSPTEAIEELLRRPQEMLKGVAEVFVGRETISRGSGFVVSKDGFVVSDMNVVGDNETVFVKLLGEEKVRSAKVIGKNPDNFLALLKLPEGRYPALDIVKGVNIGEKLYKASARSGFSEGIVQSIQVHSNLYGPAGPMVLKDVIITSAISEAGDSGSPVLNESMKVVGVIVAGSQTQTIIVPVAQVITAFPQAFNK